MKSSYLLLVIAITFGISPASGQKWVTMMQDPNTNFYDVQKEFNKEWELKEKEMFLERRSQSGKPPSASEDEELKGGYMPYKRWEYFMEPRVYPTGERLSPNIAWNNYRTWLAANAPKNQEERTENGTSNWSLIGPVNQGCSGRVNLVQFDPADSNTVYAGGANGGLWISHNGGTTWSSNTDQFGSLGVSDLAIDPVNNNIMYLATGDNDHSDSYSVGILKSTDGGVTWNPTGLTYSWSQGTDIGRVIIDPVNTNILLASTSSGIMRSTDAGDHWTQIISGNFDDVVFNPGNPNIVYASTYGTYYRSANNGVSFGVVSGGLPASGNLNRMKIAVTPADSNYVYIVTGSSSTSGLYGFYLSTDEGLTFTQQSTSPNLLGSQSWYATAICVSPVNKGEVLVGGLTCYLSTNAGVNWTDVGEAIHVDYHNARFSPNGGTIMVGNDGGAYKTYDGGNDWTSLQPGLQLEECYGVGLSAKTPQLLISGLQDNGTYGYDGNIWGAPILGGDGMLAFIDWSDDSYMFGEQYDGNINRSTDGGNTFNSIIGSITETGGWVTPWLQDPNVAGTIYAGMVNLWTSPDKGTTWNQSSSFSSSTTINAIAVAPSNSQYIYVGKSSYLYKTIDGGTNWSTITSTLPVGNAAITSISVSYTNPNKLWVTFSGFSASNKVYQSTDGGTTWTNLASSSLPNLPVNCSVYQNGTKNGIYIGMDIGVYYIDSTLSSWQAYSTGFPNVTSSQLQINYLTGKLVSSTFGRGIWQSDLYSPGAFPPKAIFTSSASSICTPQSIHFTDMTGFNPVTWSWTFGDGGTSSQENPVHTYIADGTYTVKLVVTNVNGSDSVTTSVSVAIPPPPAVTPASRCGSGTLNLGASPSSGGTLSWYDSVAAVMSVGSGTSFTTPVIDSSTTYYVEETVPQAAKEVGPVDNTFGAGGYFTANSDRRDYFDVYAPCTLQTVKVFSNLGGNRTIEVWNSSDILVNSTTVNIPNGTYVVNLNFPLTPGTGYYIKADGTVNLYRNSASANFPYTLPGVISITGTDAGDAIHYYYFYDWSVQVEPCISNRVPVTATILFETPVITRSGDTLTSSAGTSYQWYLNSTIIPGATNQSYFAINNGTYSVQVTGNGCTIMSDPLPVIILGITEAGNGGFGIYPNPTGNQFMVYGLQFTVGATINIYTALGKNIYNGQLESANSKEETVIDVSSFSRGIYFVQVTTDEGKWVKMLVKE